jgi:hypothetical protein
MGLAGIMVGMKRAGEFLSAIIDTDLLKKAGTYSGFFSAWAEITKACGIAAAAGHSQVRELEKGIVVVEADHPGWIQLLQTKANWILSETRRRFPELDVRGISFALAKPSAQSTQTPSAPANSTTVEPASAPAIPQPVLTAAEDLAAAKAGGVGTTTWERITNSDFKDSLKQLEKSIKEREKSSRKP